MLRDFDYFKLSKSFFMINYWVEYIEVLVEWFCNQGIIILDVIEIYDYGKFVYIFDLEGNKVEFWELVDQVFIDYSKGKVNWE